MTALLEFWGTASRQAAALARERKRQGYMTPEIQAFAKSIPATGIHASVVRRAAAGEPLTHHDLMRMQDVLDKHGSVPKHSKAIGQVYSQLNYMKSGVRGGKYIPPSPGIAALMAED